MGLGPLVPLQRLRGIWTGPHRFSVLVSLQSNLKRGASKNTPELHAVLRLVQAGTRSLGVPRGFLLWVLLFGDSFNLHVFKLFDSCPHADQVTNLVGLCWFGFAPLEGRWGKPRSTTKPP